jgi:hypothetical protein
MEMKVSRTGNSQIAEATINFVNLKSVNRSYSIRIEQINGIKFKVLFHHLIYVKTCLIIYSKMNKVSTT